jgi:hypothetical protein
MKDILKVIYSPVKAFESIVKKPDVKGPLIILTLILLSAVIEQSALASKVFLATRTPGNDQWTESISSSWNWSSNGIISLDNVTYVIGNYSVKSTISNSTSIWMKITNIGTLDCLGDEGYKKLSFWINWANPSKTPPNSSTLRLFSTSESQYFELNASDLVSEFSGNWTVTTSGVAVGPDSQEDWVPKGDTPRWENIMGLEFTLNWSERANLTINIDDLYFVKKSSSFLTTNSLGNIIFFTLINTLIGFFLTWITYMGSFFVISGIVHEKIGSWRVLFIVIGYALASAIVGVLVRAILYLSLPALSFPLSSWPPLTLDDQIRASVLEEHFWASNTAYPLSLIVNLGLDIWIVALCAISVRSLGGLSWKKTIMLAAFAYFIKFFLFGLGSMI